MLQALTVKQENTMRTIGLVTAALAFSLAATACTTTAPAAAPAPPAPVVYRLTACTDSAHHNCRDISEHPSSGACEAAKKTYLAQHPSESAGCNRKP